MLPDFEACGNLPPGIYKADWAEFEERFGWNKSRRLLLRGLKEAVVQFRVAGCRRVLVDGSFVTTADTPHDYDACWDGFGVDVSFLDPVFLRFENNRAAQKLRYGGEFFPALYRADQTRVFIDFFQRDKSTGEQKGIVALNPASVL